MPLGTDSHSKRIRTIIASAPVRICDLGGWTDTWFARYGKVLNIAVSPGVEVRIDVFKARGESSPPVIHAVNFGDRYVMKPRRGKHPLIEAALRSARFPSGCQIEVTVRSGVPPGASTGTSAAVGVALTAALGRLMKKKMSGLAIAGEAHRIETQVLGWQSGIQDQICSACGGVSFIAMDQYPHSRVTGVRLSPRFRKALETRLLLVYLGKAHRSTDIHERIIRHLRRSGPECRELEDLRKAAERGFEALAARDLQSFGAAMAVNTAAQERLHASLIGRDARSLIRLARDHGALGWKVNGAGGEGGSVTLLTRDPAVQSAELLKAIRKLSPLFKILPMHFSSAGVRVRET